MVGRWWGGGGEIIALRCVGCTPHAPEAATLRARGCDPMPQPHAATPCHNPMPQPYAATLCAHRPRPTVARRTSPPPQTSSSRSGGREATGRVYGADRAASRSSDSRACPCPRHRRCPRRRRLRLRSRFRRRRRCSHCCQHRCRRRRSRRLRCRCVGRTATRRDSGYCRPWYCSLHTPRGQPPRYLHHLHLHHHHRHRQRRLHRRLAGRPGCGSAPVGWRAPTRSSHPS